VAGEITPERVPTKMIPRLVAPVKHGNQLVLPLLPQVLLCHRVCSVSISHNKPARATVLGYRCVYFGYVVCRELFCCQVKVPTNEKTWALSVVPVRS
jgi:hypothetical protein